MKNPTKKQKHLAIKLIFGTQYLIDVIDELKGTTFFKNHIKTKAVNLSKDLIVNYELDIKALFNWNTEIVSEININYDKFWSHVLNMNPTELSDLVVLLDKAKVIKNSKDEN